MGACTKAAICSTDGDFLLGSSVGLTVKIYSISQICSYPGFFFKEGGDFFSFSISPPLPGKKKLSGFSPLANYTNRVIAADQRR
jgi:hypothetical protein